MDLSPSDLEGKSTREILQELIEYVTKTGQEMEQKRNRSGEQTDLNIYLCDNKGYKLGELDAWVTRLAEDGDITGHAGNFVANHTFSEEVVNGDLSLVTISTPAKNREDDFVFLTNDGYLWILTTTHSDWREKTIENLINYLPCIERLYLSSEDLEALTNDIRDSRVSGFTAKYHAPNRQRDATLMFSGAEDGDLEKAEETFAAKPTRIEFDQTNSPSTAIQGANTNDGRLSMRSVRHGSEAKAIDTIIGITGSYQDLDRANFTLEHPVGLKETGNGLTIEGFTAIELTNPDRKATSIDELTEELEDAVLNSNQYRFSTRDGGSKIRVYDTDHREMFDLALEPPNLILYPKESTTALSLRNFVRVVYEDLDSTYSLQKSSVEIPAQ